MLEGFPVPLLKVILIFPVVLIIARFVGALQAPDM
jgi:hypothetical protein